MSTKLMVPEVRGAQQRARKFAIKKQEPRRARIARVNDAALARALKRAEETKVEILARPDMLNGEALAKRLGLSRATVDNRRVAGKLLALDFGTKRGVRYPAWQESLVSEPAQRESFETVLSSLGSVGPWSRYRFFTYSSPALGGLTPKDALLSGHNAAVLHAAKTWGSGEQGGA